MDNFFFNGRSNEMKQIIYKASIVKQVHKKNSNPQDVFQDYMHYDCHDEQQQLILQWFEQVFITPYNLLALSTMSFTSLMSKIIV